MSDTINPQSEQLHTANTVGDGCVRTDMSCNGLKRCDLKRILLRCLYVLVAAYSLSLIFITSVELFTSSHILEWLISFVDLVVGLYCFIVVVDRNKIVKYLTLSTSRSWIWTGLLIAIGLYVLSVVTIWFGCLLSMMLGHASNTFSTVVYFIPTVLTTVCETVVIVMTIKAAVRLLKS